MKTILTCSFLLILFSSCSSGLRISPLRCDGHQKWSIDKRGKEDQTFSFSRSVETNWFFGDIKRIRIDKYFEEEGIPCESVSSLNIEVNEEFSDVLSSIFFMPSKKVVVSGTHITSSEDDDRVLSIKIKDD
ncbi:MAG: hypothetical protein KAG61_04705 [Bacteriovoracaceae bacterium]|nr:hypothetical protein [Bacteriovoracaceae bacterium]